ncbi:ABC-type phosphate transport system auxiliary subunit [Desulfohalotomaculum tongense]|uniref:YhcN/YlaJ family sporulation lipoprotein n=1 Tax=Desulforadius tongensis TaxID=1216062 RepID=UPI0019563E10|nr:YhcN/YlaJ family sporulation lipoprotein [Desulforadius tongensis]MBM7855297.1 ABC-type phosphate transport system auxiliary subunit [Desulforadius tongensis]
MVVFSAKSLKTLVLLILLFITAGCAVGHAPAEKPQQQAVPVKEIKVDPGLAEQVKKTVRTVDGVADSTAVVVNKNISAAIKVSGFDRLRLQKIKQQVHDKIKKINKGYTVRVTADKKLFFQLQQIEKQIKSGKQLSLPKIDQKVNKINEDMKG